MYVEMCQFKIKKYDFYDYFTKLYLDLLHRIVSQHKVV